MNTRPDDGVLDELAIIITEAQALAGGTTDAATAIATIRQAAYTLKRVAGNDMVCARLTHSNGRLIGRYLPARDTLGGA